MPPNRASRLARLTERFGVEISRVRGHRFGTDADRDIAVLLADVFRPVVLDVGANRGQSVLRFHRLLPGCEIHSFEPAPEVFRALEDATKLIPNVHLTNAGVGSAARTLMLGENERSVMSSFLRPGRAGWGSVTREIPVDVVTLDAYAQERGIDRVGLLKTDTQGFDLEVLKGAGALIAEKRVRLVFSEVNFSEVYVDQARFDDLFGFMADHGFRLVSLYNTAFSASGLANWCDVLSANPAVQLTG